MPKYGIYGTTVNPDLPHNLGQQKMVRLIGVHGKSGFQSSGSHGLSSSKNITQSVLVTVINSQIESIRDIMSIGTINDVGNTNYNLRV